MITCSCNFYLLAASATVMLPVALESGIARIFGQGTSEFGNRVQFLAMPFDWT